MRDDHFFTTTNHLQQYGDIGGNWWLWSEAWQNHVISRTYRSEAASTVPVGGVYVNPTAYRAFFFFSSPSGGNYDYQYGGSGRKYRFVGEACTSRAGVDYTYGCNSSYPHDPLIPYSLVQKCEAAALSQMKNGAYDWGQSLAESRQTGQMTLAALMALLKLLIDLRRGNYKFAIKNSGLRPWEISRVVAKGYVAGSWGILPMMSDIHANCRRLAGEIIPNARPNIRVAMKDPGFGLPGSTPGIASTITGKCERGVEVGINFSVKNQELYDLDRYGVIDPLTMAWNLVPMSFILDWVTGVKDFLEALTPPMGVQFHSGYVTRFLNNVYEVEYLWGPTDVLISGTKPKISVNQHSMLRSTYLTFPIPTPYLDLKTGIDTGKAISLIALARTLWG